MKRAASCAFVIVSSAVCACAAPDRASENATQGEQAFSSREAILLDFEFDGQLVTDTTWGPEVKIGDQLLYTVGHLNADRSVGRLDNLTLTNIQTTPLADGGYSVTYHAKMPVAWGKRTAIPTTYTMTVPKVSTWPAFDAFTTKYEGTCVDAAAHDVNSGSMWYYYRPKASGCALDPNDVVKFTATVSTSTENTSGKYPEYDRVWADDELQVAAIFGKYEDGATSPSDAGIAAYNEFIASMTSTLGGLGMTTDPPNVPAAPGTANPDVTFHAQLADGKKVTVTALLIDSVVNPGAAFDPRYESLSRTADVIAYNGHSGLGQNVAALAQKGQWEPGKYLILFMNGCVTFAYVDGALAQKRAALNPDDPSGTKYMDIVTNAMPAYFASDSQATTALVKGLISTAKPKTYQEMFASIDPLQVVLVTGEEDNVFKPGTPLGTNATPTSWGGLDGSGIVLRNQERRYETPELPAGTYTFAISGSGDADLYVKTGSPPTTSSYDCRPYKNGSAESCTVTLSSPAVVDVMVRGYAAVSSFTLSGH